MNGQGVEARRWDPIVRLTHWSIAAAIIVNRLITEGGSQVHVWVGVSIGALLVLRLFWGLVGPREARFSAFPPSPRRALAYIQDLRQGRPVQHRSHNPLGALMVYALWATMAVVIASGLAMTGFPPKAQDEAVRPPPSAVHGVARDEAREERGEGGEQEGEEESLAEEIHELSANLLLGLAVLHVAGVIFEVRRSGRRIVTAMIDGGPRAKEP